MHTVSTTMHFLEDSDVFQLEKPYLLAFEPPEGISKSNMTLREHDDVLVEDIRGREHESIFGETGYAVLNFQSQMQYEDFDDEKKVNHIYLREVAENLKAFLGAMRVQIYEHLLRKVDASFPISTGKQYKYNQPTTIAHIDTTTEWTAKMVENLCGDSASGLLKGRVQAINVWKPLRGPVRDWPLALCDRSTVDLAKDVKAADLVFANHAVENCQIHHSRYHKWYYLSDQEPGEAWIFLQSDSADAKRSGVPHSSIPLHERSEIEVPRESVEVRALVYYGEMPDE